MDDGGVGFEMIAADAAALLKALPFEAGRVRSRRLFTGGQVTVLGVAMDAAAVMRDHVTHVPILIHVIEGQAQLQVRGERIVLPAGAVVHVDAGVRHQVEADERTRFLLLLLGEAAGSSHSAHVD